MGCVKNLAIVCFDDQDAIDMTAYVGHGIDRLTPPPSLRPSIVRVLSVSELRKRASGEEVGALLLAGSSQAKRFSKFLMVADEFRIPVFLGGNHQVQQNDGKASPKVVHSFSLPVDMDIGSSIARLIIEEDYCNLQPENPPATSRREVIGQIRQKLMLIRESADEQIKGVIDGIESSLELLDS
jgi:hypothetical protein